LVEFRESPASPEIKNYSSLNQIRKKLFRDHGADDSPVSGFDEQAEGYFKG